MEARWAQGQFDQLPALAAELVRGGVAVIVTTGLGSALAAKAATTTIPVVFVGADNPVRFGLVASLNRPGGNATGLNLLTSELTAKRLEIVRQLLPGTATVAVIINPNSPEVAPQLADVQSDVQDRNRLPQGARRAPATKATSTLLSRHSPNTGLTRSCREPICLARRKPSLNGNVLSLDPAKFPQSLQEGFAPIGVVERCKAAAGQYTRSIVEIPDAPHFDRLLSVPQERPPRCCATEEDDEFSPSHADHGLPPSHASFRRS